MAPTPHGTSSSSFCFAILMTGYVIFLMIMWLSLTVGPLIVEVVVHVMVQNNTAPEDNLVRWVPIGFSIFQTFISLVIAFYLADTLSDSLDNHPDYYYNGSKRWREVPCSCLCDSSDQDKYECFRSFRKMTILFLKSTFSLPVLMSAATLWWLTSLFLSTRYGNIQGIDWLAIFSPIAIFALALIILLAFKAVRKAQIRASEEEIKLNNSLSIRQRVELARR